MSLNRILTLPAQYVSCILYHGQLHAITDPFTKWRIKPCICQTCSMHMSSACPTGLSGGYVREFEGIKCVLCPWVGGSSRDCSRINECGWNSQDLWGTNSNHRHIRGIFSAEKNLTRGIYLINFAPSILQSPGRGMGVNPMWQAMSWTIHNRMPQNLFTCSTP